jgi:hypothetical protein
VIVAFMLSVAMCGTRRDNPRTWGNLEILAGCCLVWNAIAVAIHPGPQAQTEGAAHAAQSVEESQRHAIAKLEEQMFPSVPKFGPGSELIH